MMPSSVEGFVHQIRSETLRGVVCHWNEIRRGRLMPAWRDIRPARLVKQLPILWSYSYEVETGRFIGRLAGNRIERKFARPFKGAGMDELYAGEDFTRLFAVAKLVIEGPRLYRARGEIFDDGDFYGFGERIFLPLSSDGVVGDGLFGATDFMRLPNIAHECLPETETWLTLFPRSDLSVRALNI